MINIHKVEPEDKRRIFKLGLQVLDESLPPGFSEDPYNCPFLINDSCEGAKDPEYSSRCSGEDFQYASCEIYKLRMNSQNTNPPVVDQSLQDTVIMKRRDLSGDRRRIVPKDGGDYESIHDQVANSTDNRSSTSFIKAMLGNL